VAYLACKQQFTLKRFVFSFGCSMECLGGGGDLVTFFLSY
jgi:hypothetical protein